MRGPPPHSLIVSRAAAGTTRGPSMSLAGPGAAAATQAAAAECRDPRLRTTETPLYIVGGRPIRWETRHESAGHRRIRLHRGFGRERAAGRGPSGPGPGAL